MATLLTAMVWLVSYTDVAVAGVVQTAYAAGVRAAQLVEAIAHAELITLAEAVIGMREERVGVQSVGVASRRGVTTGSRGA